MVGRFDIRGKSRKKSRLGGPARPLKISRRLSWTNNTIARIPPRPAALSTTAPRLLRLDSPSASLRSPFPSESCLTLVVTMVARTSSPPPLPTHPPPPLTNRPPANPPLTPPTAMPTMPMKTTTKATISTPIPRTFSQATRPTMTRQMA